MINLNKKVVGIISFGSACTIGAATTLSTIALTKDNEVIDNNEISNYPLNRNIGYTNYSISENLINSKNIEQIVSIINDGENYLYVINEQTFLQNIEPIIRDTFSNISKFSSNRNNYKIECNYLIASTSTIQIDLVWYLPNSKIKYFDQFEINLLIY